MTMILVQSGSVRFPKFTFFFPSPLSICLWEIDIFPLIWHLVSDPVATFTVLNDPSDFFSPSNLRAPAPSSLFPSVCPKDFTVLNQINVFPESHPQFPLQTHNFPFSSSLMTERSSYGRKYLRNGKLFPNRCFLQLRAHSPLMARFSSSPCAVQ